MKYSIVVLLFLISIFELSSCGYCFNNGTNSLEMYCRYFTMSVDCDFDLKPGVNWSLIPSPNSHIKFRECDLNKVANFIEDKNLASLDISKSNYRNLDPIKEMKSEHLVKLNASHNKIERISVIDFEGVPNIKKIDFSHNQIRFIGKSDFDGANKLTMIYLSNNYINFIDNDSFERLENLEFIDLSANLIVTVDKVFQNNKKLKMLRLKENPFFRFGCDFVQLAKGGASLYFSWEKVDSYDVSKNLIK